MSSIAFASQHGVHTARGPSTHPSIPGPLVASAMTGVDGWFVSNRRPGGVHLIFVADETVATQLLAVVAGELT